MGTVEADEAKVIEEKTKVLPATRGGFVALLVKVSVVEAVDEVVSAKTPGSVKESADRTKVGGAAFATLVVKVTETPAEVARVKVVSARGVG